MRGEEHRKPVGGPKCVVLTHRTAEVLLRILKNLGQVGLFVLMGVVLFAWLATLMLDDTTANVYADVPVPANLGFDTFRNSLYTAFVAQTTANLPGAMIPSFTAHRWFIVVWFLFFVFAVFFFAKVVLAVVYANFQSETKHSTKKRKNKQKLGTKQAFNCIQTDGSVKEDDFIKTCQELTASGAIHVDKELIHCIFVSLDDAQNGVLNEEEFADVQTVLLTNIWVTERYSAFYKYFKEYPLMKAIKSFCTNAKERFDSDGYSETFNGSMFDKVMQLTLVLNAMFVILSSYFDLDDLTEPSMFWTVDVFFSLIYVPEVLIKLSIWSFGEYWAQTDCKFDFITTIVLAASGIILCIPQVQITHDVLRYLNVMRILRVLKALDNVELFQRLSATIYRMACNSGDVIAMNIMVLYIWSVIGVQLFGGKLLRSNPVFEGKDFDYFDSNYMILNFNDVPLAFVTMNFFTLTGWVDPIAVVCMALGESGSFINVAASCFMYSFYIGSFLLAFNVFTAFSIDMYQELNKENGDRAVDSMSKNLETVKLKMGKMDKVMHTSISLQLDKWAVYDQMFLQDT